MHSIPTRKPKTILEGFLNPELFSRASDAIEKASLPISDSSSQNPTDCPKEKSTITQPISLPITQTVTQSDSRSDSRSDSNSNDKSDRKANRNSNDKSDHKTNHNSNDKFDHKTNHNSGDKSDRKTNDRTDLKTAYPLDEMLGDPVLGLTQTQLDVFRYLSLKTPPLTTRKSILHDLNLPEGTLSWTMKVLKEKNLLLTTKRYRNGCFQGFTFSLNENAVRNLTDNNSYRNSDDKSYYNSDRNSGDKSDHYLNHQTNNPIIIHPVTHPVTLTTLDDDLLYIKNHHLTDEDLQDMYPELYAVGFRFGHVRQTIKSWRISQLNLEELHDSLEKAEWDVAHNKEKMKSPCAYVLSALKRGSYTAPQGFKFRRQLQAEETEKNLKETEKKLKEIQNKNDALKQAIEENTKVCFEHWWLVELTAAQRQEVDGKLSKANKALPASGTFRHEARMAHYRDHIHESEHSI